MPRKKKVINGLKVEEYYWNGKYVVYIDNYFTYETFGQACERLAREILMRRY